MTRKTIPEAQSHSRSTPRLRPEQPGTAVQLPAPRQRGAVSLEECLSARRSCRIFTDDPVGLADLSQLLWAAQGVTGVGGLRTAPSAGASYPLETYVCAARVDGLPAGVYHYDPDSHALKLLFRGDRGRSLVRGACNQNCVAGAAAAIVLTAVYRRLQAEFGPGATRLTHLEAGHAMQNVCLQATALGLGVIGLGRIDEAALRNALRLPERHEPVSVVIVGRKWM